MSSTRKLDKKMILEAIKNTNSMAEAAKALKMKTHKLSICFDLSNTNYLQLKKNEKYDGEFITKFDREKTYSPDDFSICTYYLLSSYYRNRSLHKEIAKNLNLQIDQFKNYLKNTGIKTADFTRQFISFDDVQFYAKFNKENLESYKKITEENQNTQFREMKFAFQQKSMVGQLPHVQQTLKYEQTSKLLDSFFNNNTLMSPKNNNGFYQQLNAVSEPLFSPAEDVQQQKRVKTHHVPEEEKTTTELDKVNLEIEDFLDFTQEFMINFDPNNC